MRRTSNWVLKQNILTEEQYNTIRPTGSQPAILYGLPKVHKPNTPLRPVMSSLNTYNRKLSEFLIPFIAPLTHNEYTVQSSFSFCNEIQKFITPTPFIMCSFDIESLYTNVPLYETIDLVVDELFLDTDHVGNFNKQQFKHL